MTIKKDSDNTIKMVKGDTGRIKFKGLPTDRNYIVFFVILNSKKEIVTELQTAANKNTAVVFNITQDISNKLTVVSNLEFQTYYYGLKLCDNDTKEENTITIKPCKFGEMNKLIVFPLNAEGI